MFASIAGLLKGDLDRQVSWAKKEFSRQAGTAALKAGLAIGVGIAVLGTVTVGLMALYTAVALRHGPLIGYAVVGAVTAVTAIGLFIACRFVGSAVSPQPSIHSLRYDNVKEAAKTDLSAQSSAIMSSLRQSSIGGAISTTEVVLAKGERITHMASDQMRDGSRGSLIAILGVTALTGIILGKQIRPSLGKFEISGSTISSLIIFLDHLILRRTIDHHKN
jgi:hypothetical protein